VLGCGASYLVPLAGDSLSHSWADRLDAKFDFANDVRIHWTGCPNTCSQIQVCLGARRQGKLADLGRGLGWPRPIVVRKGCRCVRSARLK